VEINELHKQFLESREMEDNGERTRQGSPEISANIGKINDLQMVGSRMAESQLTTRPAPVAP
jgi:hypothetical protein